MGDKASVELHGTGRAYPRPDQETLKPAGQAVGQPCDLHHHRYIAPIHIAIVIRKALIASIETTS
jgi:hypothetical protein